MSEAVGWKAIENEVEKVYPNQKPLHFGTIIRYSLGGNDPLDGISIYETDEYYHFITFGLSDLYDEKTSDNELSGFGKEFTIKLKKDDRLDKDSEINNICNILQQLARITYKGTNFLPNQYLSTGQTVGIDAFQKSNITGFIMINDPSFNTITTPHGIVQFVEFVGVTNDELVHIINNKELEVNEFYKQLGSDTTNYFRKSIV